MSKHAEPTTETFAFQVSKGDLPHLLRFLTLTDSDPLSPLGSIVGRPGDTGAASVELAALADKADVAKAMALSVSYTHLRAHET